MTVIQVDKRDAKVLLIRMDTEEALRTIESLSNQIYTKNPNGARFEHFTEEGWSLSIAVHQKAHETADHTRVDGHS